MQTPLDESGGVLYCLYIETETKTMWTRGKDENNEGKFAYEIWNERELVERVGKFDTAQEADRAAEIANRRFVSCLMSGETFHGVFTDNMTIDEIFAELEA